MPTLEHKIISMCQKDIYIYNYGNLKATAALQLAGLKSTSTMPQVLKRKVTKTQTKNKTTKPPSNQN